jgi:hypothetical protein
VIAGVSFHPVAVIVGALAEHFLAHYWSAQNLPEEVDHLFWPGQATDIAVDDDAVKAVVYKGEQITEQPGEEFHRTLLYTGGDPMGRKTIKRGPGKRQMDGKDFRLADEIRYIQRGAAEHDGRFVTVGPLALFSTDTGDAWLLDAEDHLAAILFT